MTTTGVSCLFGKGESKLGDTKPSQVEQARLFNKVENIS